MLDASGTIGDIARQELQDFNDVGRIARGERLRDAASDKNPEWLVYVEGPEGEALFLVEPLLLKEGEETGNQISVEVVCL
jgi:hypothetical protein